MKKGIFEFFLKKKIIRSCTHKIIHPIITPYRAFCGANCGANKFLIKEAELQFAVWPT
jgi:hypothetical protein